MFRFAGKTWNRARVAAARISRTRFSIAFLLLTTIHCLAQGGIQIALYVGDTHANAVVSEVIIAAQTPANDLPWLESDGHGDYTLKVCSDVPNAPGGPASCTLVYQTSTDDSSNVSLSTRGMDRANALLFERRSLVVDQVTAILNETGGVEGVTFVYNGADSVTLSNQCARSLLYAQNVLEALRIEDVALLGSQFWLFVVSLLAIILSSVPQILAVLCTRVLSTAWAAFSIWHTLEYEYNFNRLIIDSATPCHFNFFSTLFHTRLALTISILALNCSALVSTTYLGWYLIKDFNATIFQRAGPPMEIVRIYRSFLVVWMLLQLCVFYLVTAVGLWMTWLTRGALGLISTHNLLYEGLFGITLAILIPWIAMGWFAVRREMKKLMIVFLVICFTLIACWAIMFYSEVYRWSFTEWTFFSCMTVLSFVVLLLTGVFGIICRRNFDKGLARYLYVEEALAEADFTPGVFTHELAPRGRVRSQNLSIYSEEASQYGSTLTKDFNWDPYDVERPPIMIVTLTKHDRPHSKS